MAACVLVCVLAFVLVPQARRLPQACRKVEAIAEEAASLKGSLDGYKFQKEK